MKRTPIFTRICLLAGFCIIFQTSIVQAQRVSGQSSNSESRISGNQGSERINSGGNSGSSSSSPTRESSSGNSESRGSAGDSRRDSDSRGNSDNSGAEINSGSSHSALPSSEVSKESVGGINSRQESGSETGHRPESETKVPAPAPAGGQENNQNVRISLGGGMFLSGTTSGNVVHNKQENPSKEESEQRQKEAALAKLATDIEMRRIVAAQKKEEARRNGSEASKARAEIRIQKANLRGEFIGSRVTASGKPNLIPAAGSPGISGPAIPGSRPDGSVSVNPAGMNAEIAPGIRPIPAGMPISSNGTLQANPVTGERIQSSGTAIGTRQTSDQPNPTVDPVSYYGYDEPFIEPIYPMGGGDFFGGEAWLPYFELQQIEASFEFLNLWSGTPDWCEPQFVERFEIELDRAMRYILRIEQIWDTDVFMMEWERLYLIYESNSPCAFSENVDLYAAYMAYFELKAGMVDLLIPDVHIYNFPDSHWVDTTFAAPSGGFAWYDRVMAFNPLDVEAALIEAVAFDENLISYLPFRQLEEFFTEFEKSDFLKLLVWKVGMELDRIQSDEITDKNLAINTLQNSIFIIDGVLEILPDNDRFHKAKEKADALMTELKYEEAKKGSD